MIIGTAKIYLYADWVHSLKEKRMIVRSIVDRMKHHFNVSIAEIEELDTHQTIVLGIACVSNSTVHANESIQKAVQYVEQHAEAVVEDIIIEML